MDVSGASRRAMQCRHEKAAVNARQKTIPFWKNKKGGSLGEEMLAVARPRTVLSQRRGAAWNLGSWLREGDRELETRELRDAKEGSQSTLSDHKERSTRRARPSASYKVDARK